MVLLLLAAKALAVEVLEEVVEQRHVLAPGATLSITNTDGSIHIYAADVSEISIEAIKKAYTPERLRGIIVEVKATRDGVTIDTMFPPRKNAWSDRSGTVEYILIVPQMTKITKLNLVNGEVLIEGLRGGSARAHLVNGWLGGHNCFGDLDLTVDNGRLDVAYDWWEERKFSVTASSTNGNLRAILPSDASVTMSARTEAGRIADAFATQKERVRQLHTSMGTEVPASLKLNATNGNISIEKAY